MFLRRKGSGGQKDSAMAVFVCPASFLLVQAGGLVACCLCCGLCGGEQVPMFNLDLVFVAESLQSVG